GREITKDELMEKGNKIYMEKLKLKMEMGFDWKKLRIPDRIFETESPHGVLKKEYIERALNYYREKYLSACC
ncbi:MAG: aldehyde:ferredoxin oxidoreductase, partial [Thermoplasmata archaeon]